MAQQLVKYMGTSDIHTLQKGEDFDGQLRDGLPKDLVFDKSNKWVVDVSDLSEEAVTLLLEVSDGTPNGKEFRDVTGLKRVPSNRHQQIFLGHKASEEPERALPDEVTTDTATDDDPKHASGTTKKAR